MTSYFPPGDLPGNPVKRIDSDVSTWGAVFDVAEELYWDCVDQENSAGWARTGEFTTSST